MNLLNLRTQWVEKNGRYDLVIDTTNYADNGANFYLQVGQRILDAIFPVRKQPGKLVIDLATGQSSLLMKHLRSIDSVYIEASGITRDDLSRKPYSWLIEQYGDDFGQKAIGKITFGGQPSAGEAITIDTETYTFNTDMDIGTTLTATIDNFVTAINAASSIVNLQRISSTEVIVTYYLVGTAGNAIAWSTTAGNLTLDGSGYLGGTIAGRANQITTGTPLYYAPIITTPHPYLTLSNIGSLNTSDLLLGYDKHQWDGLLFMPPANQAYTMTVFAHFFTVLSSDLDTSYYSEQYPEACMLAANMAVEMFYRNQTGVREIFESLKIILDGVDKDLVLSEMALSGNQMRG